MLRVGVLVSGGGTNLQAIFDKIESGYLSNCTIVTVVSSNEKAYALKRARK
ncbi:MAG TPA: formyltransferase family protein, partial [Clostridia bacterium]|nr:formyltransferase family protein [Clostridia bacterium]